MATYPLQMSEETYHRLSEQAARLHLTPEQVIERLVDSDVAQFVMASAVLDPSVPPSGPEEALAAVGRLTTLFADTAISEIDQVLADPMIALSNVDVASLPHHP